ncbi:hypothetical protein TNCV_1841521 [Trichonephila clavipes]|nr:hypothetical protein TNCV_1841521 [Trichonephila clavipes]
MPAEAPKTRDVRSSTAPTRVSYTNYFKWLQMNRRDSDHGKKKSKGMRKIRRVQRQNNRSTESNPPPGYVAWRWIRPAIEIVVGASSCMSHTFWGAEVTTL